MAGGRAGPAAMSAIRRFAQVEDEAGGAPVRGFVQRLLNAAATVASVAAAAAATAVATVTALC